MDWRFDGLTALVSIAAGKAAELVVLAGNRAKKHRRRRESGDRLQRRHRLRPREADAFGRRTDGVALTECGGRPAGESASSELSRCSPIVEWPRRDCYLNPRGKVVFCSRGSAHSARPRRLGAIHTDGRSRTEACTRRSRTNGADPRALSYNRCLANVRCFSSIRTLSEARYSF